MRLIQLRSQRMHMRACLHLIRTATVSRRTGKIHKLKKSKYELVAMAYLDTEYKHKCGESRGKYSLSTLKLPRPCHRIWGQTSGSGCSSSAHCTRSPWGGQDRTAPRLPDMYSVQYVFYECICIIESLVFTCLISL